MSAWPPKRSPPSLRRVRNLSVDNQVGSGEADYAAMLSRVAQWLYVNRPFYFNFPFADDAEIMGTQAGNSFQQVTKQPGIRCK